MVSFSPEEEQKEEGKGRGRTWFWKSACAADWFAARLASPRAARAAAIAPSSGAKNVKPCRPPFSTSKNGAGALALAFKAGRETLRRRGARSAREVLSSATVSASEPGKPRTWSIVWMVTLPNVVVFDTVGSFLWFDFHWRSRSASEKGIREKGTR